MPSPSFPASTTQQRDIDVVPGTILFSVLVAMAAAGATKVVIVDEPEGTVLRHRSLVDTTQSTAVPCPHPLVVLNETYDDAGERLLLALGGPSVITGCLRAAGPGFAKGDGTNSEVFHYTYKHDGREGRPTLVVMADSISGNRRKVQS